MAVTPFIVLIVVGSFRGDADVITEAIRSMLALKGTAYPYSVEYDLALPAQPRMAGTTEKRRIFAESPDHFYSEQSTANQRLRTLVNDKKILFAYSDDTNGQGLCVGPVDLGGKRPERWLEDRGFVFNSYPSYDADLIKVVRELLAGSKVTRHDVTGQVHTYHLSGSRLGNLVITLGPRTIEMSAVVPDATPPKLRTVFRYIHHDGRSPWSAAALAELKADFEKAGDKGVQKLVGPFTMFTALAQCFPRAGEIRVITDAESKDLAVRHGYLLPNSPQAKIIEAKDFSGQLHLKVKFNGKIYSIGQYPAVPRNNEKSLEGFVNGRRKFGDYTVLDVSDPGTESNWIYYLKNDVALQVQDPDYKRIPFMDHNLDRLIATFSALRSGEEGK